MLSWYIFKERLINVNREYFIKQLEEALTGELTTSAIRENINYYNSYIIDEVNSGKTEEEVLISLGDPWVIAKTVIQTQGDFSRPGEQNFNSVDYHFDGERDGYREGRYGGARNPHVKVHTFGLTSWKQRLMIIGAITLVIGVIIVLIVGVLSLLAPIIVPLIILLILLKLFRRRN
jgi:hypothetical protein